MLDVMSSCLPPPASSLTAVGGPLCGERISALSHRLWHSFDPDQRLRPVENGASGTFGAHTMAGDDAELGDLLHSVITRHGYLLPAAVIRGCYYRTVAAERSARYLDLGRQGDSPDQQRYRRLGIFTMYHASHRRFREQGLRRFNPELALAVRADWPLDASVQSQVDDYLVGHRR